MNDAGSDGAGPVSYVRLTGDALDAVERLHRRSIAGADPGLVKPEKRSFFESVFAGRGEVVGAIVAGDDPETRVAGGRLAGYGVLLTTLAEGEDAGRRIGLSSKYGLAKIAGTGVDPADRGRGLQRSLVRWRIGRAGERGFTHVFATAAPANTVSWRNLMAEGFSIVDVVLAYGTLERFLMHRPVAAAARGGEAPRTWCAADRTDEVRKALSAGLVGPAWREHAAAGRPTLDIGFVPGAAVRA